MIAYKKFRTLLALAIVIILISSCIHIEPSHYGTIKDTETLEPINGVEVFERLKYECLLPPSPGGANYEQLGNASATSNAKGEYSLPIKIFLKPPLLCRVSNTVGFIKPGYLQYGYGLNGPYDKVAEDPQDIKLLKMTHYLNLLPYIETLKYQLYSDEENLPDNYKAAYNSMKTIKTTALDEDGIFIRVKDRKFTRIYNLESPTGNKIVYVYDEITNNWLQFDFRGKPTSSINENQPPWLFASQRVNTHWTIYSDSKTIHFFPHLNPMPAGSNYNKKEIKTITSKFGKLSDIAGYSGSFITIENDGENLCHYGRTEKMNEDPTFIKGYSGKDLPPSTDDNTITNSKFMFFSSSSDTYFVLTKSDKYWHIYNVDMKFLRPISHSNIKEIGKIPLEYEITSFISDGHQQNANFFISTRNKGIKVYKTDNYKFSEVNDKNINFNKEIYKNISALALGYIDVVPIIYAVSGDNKIYRFTREGIPDHPISFSQPPN